ncbi:MAG: hypothetical protein HYV07_16190 [Deltaproteobacteria bacterium]|nr:hypothetical protein [Deltaproteobacteria bacterium]
MTSTTIPTFQWSEVQRHPAKVEKALRAHGRVSLERRGAAPMLLLDSADQEANVHAVGAAAALLGALLKDSGEFPTDALLRAFPWATVLDERHRRLMADELVNAGVGGAALGELREFELIIRQWRNTAEAKAAGVDLSSSLRSTNVGGVTKRPPAPKKAKRDRKA